MSEQVIKLGEKQYSIRTAAKVVGMCEGTVYQRAKKLGIDTRMGLTAKDVKRIQEYRSGKKQMRKCSVQELVEELGEMK